MLQRVQFLLRRTSTKYRLAKARIIKPHRGSKPNIKPPLFPKISQYFWERNNFFYKWRKENIIWRTKEDHYTPYERPEDTYHYAELRYSAFRRKIPERMKYLREALHKHVDEIYELAKPENMDQYFLKISEDVVNTTQEYGLESRIWRKRQTVAALDATDRLQSKGYDPWFRNTFDTVREYLTNPFNRSSNLADEDFIENMWFSDEDPIDDMKTRDLIFRITMEKQHRETQILLKAEEYRHLYRTGSPQHVLDASKEALIKSMIEHEGFVAQIVKQLEEQAQRQQARTFIANGMLKLELNNLRKTGKFALDTVDAVRQFMYPQPYFDPVLHKYTIGPLPPGPTRIPTREVQALVSDVIYGISEYDAEKWQRYYEFRRRAYSWGMLDRFPRTKFEELESPLMELNEKLAPATVKLKDEHRYVELLGQDVVNQINEEIAAADATETDTNDTAAAATPEKIGRAHV